MLTADRIYDHLKKDPEKWNDYCKSTDEMEFNMTEENRATIRLVLTRVVREIGSHDWGTAPGIDTMVLKSVRAKKRDYVKILEQFVGRLRSEPMRSWTRVHRRHPLQIPGKKKGQKPLLCVVIDTSGSMWDEAIFKEIMRELLALKQVTEKIHVVVGDTELKGKWIFRHKLNASAVKFSGGGGTDLQFGWDYARDMKCDAVICYTDGWCGEIKDYEVPSFFMLTCKNQEFDKGGSFAKYPSLQIMEQYA
jgi:predicted metal-dependent peptidase